MELIIKRDETNGQTILGKARLQNNGKLLEIFETLERRGYEIKKGIYNANYSYSPKFNGNRYRLNVSGRRGILIHEGNTYEDSTGCILIGTYRTTNKILQSRKALKLLHALSKKQKLNIIIK